MFYLCCVFRGHLKKVNREFHPHFHEWLDWMAEVNPYGILYSRHDHVWSTQKSWKIPRITWVIQNMEHPSIHFGFNREQFPSSCWWKAFPQHNATTPCFTVIMVLSGWKAVLGFRQEMDYITVSPCLYSSVTHVFILTVFIWLEATRQERPVRPLFLPFCLDFHKILRLNCLVEDQVALGQGDIRAISGLIPCWRGATKKKQKTVRFSFALI